MFERAPLDGEVDGLFDEGSDMRRSGAKSEA